MPRIGIVQTTNFPDLLSRMGINRNQIPFELRSEVTPVALVDSGVAFVASPSPAYRVTDVFTTGRQTNPGAGTVLADTGQLTAGSFTLKVILFSDQLNQAFDFEWRDAANAANLYTTRLRVQGDAIAVFELSF